MSKVLSSIFILVLAAQAKGKEFGLPPVDLKPGQFVEGQLFSVKLIPGKKQLQFLVVGKEQARVDLGTLKTKLKLKGEDQFLTLQSESSSYIYTRPLQEEAILEISNPQGKTDQFRLEKP